MKTTRSFPKIPDEVRSLPENPEVFWKHPKSQSQYKRELAPSAFHFKNQRSRKRYCHLFILHMVFVPYMGLSWHIFGNCVKQDGNNSHFSIRREKLARRREQAWDRSFQPAGVRLTPKAWELAGIHGGHTPNNRLPETNSLGLPCTSLILDVHAMINWHLSKQSISWPVSHGYIAGSRVELIEVTCFFEVDRWPSASFPIGSWAHVRLTCWKQGRIALKLD